MKSKNKGRKDNIGITLHPSDRNSPANEKEKLRKEIESQTKEFLKRNKIKVIPIGVSGNKHLNKYKKKED